MQLGLTTLFNFLDACRTPFLVLATVTRTHGASYRKAGAMMLIDAEYNTAGLVSGGCLEDDLKAHAERVFATGDPHTVVYDLGQEEAASMWGLGLGCGGEIDIFLERVSRDEKCGGLADIRSHYFDGQPGWLHKRVASNTGQTLGDYDFEPVHSQPGQDFSRAVRIAREDETILSIPVSPVNRLLVCGAGPDAIPLVELASRLAWQVIVTDPRAAYLTDDFFPDAHQLLCLPPNEVDIEAIGTLQAAVVMTHHVERDAAWLKILYQRPLSYIGLLGPIARRDRLLEQAGLALDPRLRGPAGLDIGATLPEEIALSIVAQIHAALEQREGGNLPQ